MGGGRTLLKEEGMRVGPVIGEGYGSGSCCEGRYVLEVVM